VLQVGCCLLWAWLLLAVGFLLMLVVLPVIGMCWINLEQLWLLPLLPHLLPLLLPPRQLLMLMLMPPPPAADDEDDDASAAATTAASAVVCTVGGCSVPAACSPRPLYYYPSGTVNHSPRAEDWEAELEAARTAAVTVSE
jgi:hypothetical protein